MTATPRLSPPWILLAGLLALLLVTTTSCGDNPLEFERINPRDPRSETFHPAPPAQLQLLLRDGVAVLTWQALSQHAEGYVIERSEDGRLFQEVARLGADARHYNDPINFPAFRVRYRVSAFAMPGGRFSMDPGPVADAVIHDVTGFPLSVTLLNEEIMRITWPTPIPFEGTYELQRQRGFEAWLTIGRFPWNTGSHVDTLTHEPTGEYRYRLRFTYDDVATGWTLSETRSIYTGQRRVEGMGLLDGPALHLRWDAEYYARRYFIERCEETGTNCRTIAEVFAPQTSFIDHEAQPGGRYGYRVRTFRIGFSWERRLRRAGQPLHLVLHAGAHLPRYA
jgi:hypothetical protein